MHSHFDHCMYFVLVYFVRLRSPEHIAVDLCTLQTPELPPLHEQTRNLSRLSLQNILENHPV